MPTITKANVTKEKVDPTLPKLKFKLLAGHHAEFRPTGEKDSNGVELYDTAVYEPGEIIETTQDLIKSTNNGAEKFRRLYEDDKSNDEVPVTKRGSATVAETVNYDKMTIVQLQKFAEEQEIDLGDLTNKAEIISYIRNHFE